MPNPTPAQTPSALPPAAPALRDWLSAKQLAGHWALCEDCVYNWHKLGFIPKRFVKLCGTRRLLFAPETVAYLEAEFAAYRERKKVAKAQQASTGGGAE